jgi:hypothetical protein
VTMTIHNEHPDTPLAGACDGQYLVVFVPSCAAASRRVMMRHDRNGSGGRRRSSLGPPAFARSRGGNDCGERGKS